MNFNKIRRYTVHMDTDTHRHETAIVAKNGLALTNIQRLPSGRRMPASFRGILTVNIYAPSGAQKSQEREAFYNTEVLYLIPSSSTAMILVGSFDCAITKWRLYRTAELQQSACETHRGTGPHRRVGDDSDTNCVHTLHCNCVHTLHCNCVHTLHCNCVHTLHCNCIHTLHCNCIHTLHCHWGFQE